MQNVKDAMTNFRSKLRLQQEPVDFLEQAIYIFEQVNNNGADKAFEGKDAVKKYFFDEFTSGIMRTLCQ